MKPATSNLACSCSLPRPIISGCGLGLGELPEIWGFPFNIYTMAEASDFKFGTQLGFAKAHHKITCRRKGRHGLGLWKLPNIGGSRWIFLQRHRCPVSISGACCMFMFYLSIDHEPDSNKIYVGLCMYVCMYVNHKLRTRQQYNNMI